jgi:hypothetical protein
MQMSGYSITSSLRFVKKDCLHHKVSFIPDFTFLLDFPSDGVI